MDSAARLEAFIDEGKTRSTRVIESLVAEAEGRRSLLVGRDHMHFVVSNDVGLQVDGDNLSFTQWSQDQMYETLSHGNTPSQLKAVIGGMATEGQQELAGTVLNGLRYRIGSVRGDPRRLLRIVGDQVRGWLSPSYRIIDQSALVTTFAAAIGHADALIVDGTLTDVRYSLEAILPQVIEVFPGEHVVPAVRMQSSDYGWGACNLAVFLYRLICLNGAMGKNIIHRIHGGDVYRGYSEDVITISEQTIQLRQAVSLSEMADGIRYAFHQDYIQDVVGHYRSQAMRLVDVPTAARAAQKSGLLTEREAGTALALMATHSPEILPETESDNSALRWGNVLSFLANQTSGERRIELQDAAGKILLPR